MSKHGNSLSKAEIERIAWLSEELGEALQCVGKILRHGYESKNPNDPHHKGNRADLEREMADIYAAISLMNDEGDISLFRVMRNSMGFDYESRYFHHQKWNTDPHKGSSNE